MLTMLAILAAFQVSNPLGDVFEQVTPQVAAERVARCGAGRVTIKSDTELDADVLVVAATAPITDQQIACIEKAASFYDVELPPNAQSRFNAATEARASALMKAENHKWLAAHNLLGRLPKYQPGVTNDGKFAERVENLCNAKGALHSRYGVHALNPDWALRQKDRAVQDQALGCVLSVSWATGYELDFIGNEQFAR